MHTVQETIAVTTIPKIRASRSCLGFGTEDFLGVVLTESRVAFNDGFSVMLTVDSSVGS